MQYPAARLLFTLAVVVATGSAGCVDDAADDESASRASPVSSCPTGTWCVESSSLTTSPLLHGVSAASASDVFAVGDGGTILRRTGGSWAAMTSGTPATLRGVWARTSSDVWAVGSGGTILRFNGTAWSAVTGVTTTNLEAVWGSGASDVWIVGSSIALHWNGATFATSALTGSLLSVSGTGANELWIAGENASVRHWTGLAWTTVSPGIGTSTFFAVLAIASNNVWVSDFLPNKEAVRYNGSTWTTTKTFGGIFNGLAANSASAIWGAGGSRVGRWNGTAWTTSQPFGSNAVLWSVAATPTDVWVVGDGALIGHQPL